MEGNHYILALWELFFWGPLYMENCQRHRCSLHSTQTDADMSVLVKFPQLDWQWQESGLSSTHLYGMVWNGNDEAHLPLCQSQVLRSYFDAEVGCSFHRIAAI